MAPGTPDLLTALVAAAAETDTAILDPSSEDFSSISLCYVRRPEAAPFAVARPSTAKGVSALLRFCVAHDLDFVIRSGGHDSAGRSQVAGALMIDMRRINGISVSSDKRTATIGGGALVRDVVGTLSAEDLVTPCGTIGSVGYVGWATLGGYGPMSGNFGLGCDQIIGAKLVTAEGELIEADAELLKGVRGAAPAFGVVVELTVKVYSLKEVLSGMIIYESSNFAATVKQWTDGFNILFASGLPPALGVQPSVVDIPQLGRVLVVLYMWSSSDQDEGRKWTEKIASLGTAIMNTVAPTSISDFVKANDALVMYGSYGQNNTVTVRGFTPKVVDIISKHADELPGGGAAFSGHLVRGPSAVSNKQSVFSPREDHVMLEMISVTTVEELVGKCNAWASALRKDIIENAGEDVVGGGYISLLSDADSNWSKIYGDNYQFLLDLKRKYDPKNVFKNGLPRLAI